jgi:hypothetical protein
MIEPMDKARTSEEFRRFNALVGKVLSVPKAVMDQREKEYQEQAKSKPKVRIPKATKTIPKEN